MASLDAKSTNLHDVREQIISFSHEQASLLEVACQSFSNLDQMLCAQSRGIHDTTDRCTLVLDEVVEGQEIVDDLSKSIETMQTLTAQLDEALTAVRSVEARVQAIRDMSVDLRMLGLNAAIEAAHAGERGQGFSVVAAAMQELAHTGSHVADSITKAIGDALSGVDGIALDCQTQIKQQVGLATRLTNVLELVHESSNSIDETTKLLAADCETHSADAGETLLRLRDRMEASSGETADLIAALTGTSVVDLSPTEAFHNLDDYVLVDVRTRKEWCDELGHLQGAKHIPIADPDFETRLTKLDHSAPTLFICRSGGRSARGASVGLELGFQSVYNLQGGMLNWDKSDLPIEAGSRKRAA
jgi:methyl-accepting chemotaxis protein